MFAKRTRSPRALYALPNTPPLAPGFEGAAKEVSQSSEREELEVEEPFAVLPRYLDCS